MSSMKLLEIRNITRKEMPLHYMNEFYGSAVFLESFSSRKVEKRLMFTVEKPAIGVLKIKVNFLDDLNYPLVPILKNIKSHIADMAQKGKLPDN